MPISRRRQHRALQIFADVQEADAAFAHQPLVGTRRGEVDAEPAHVDGDGANRLDDVGEQIGAARVREGAQ